MNQIFVLIAIVGIGYLLYRSLVIKRQPSQDEPSQGKRSQHEHSPVDSAQHAMTEQATAGETAVTNDVGQRAVAEAEAAQAKAAEKTAEKVQLETTPEAFEETPKESTPVPAELMTQVGGLNETQDPLARHRLYQQIVDASYRNRNDEEYRAALQHYAQAHLDEFASIAPLLTQQNGGKLPQVATFKHYASALSEVGLYDEAIAVCQQALEYQLKDGTKSGYQGRIERIKKLQTRDVPA